MSLNTGSITQFGWNESSAKNTNRMRDDSNSKSRAKTPISINRRRLINDFSAKRNSAIR